MSDEMHRSEKTSFLRNHRRRYAVLVRLSIGTAFFVAIIEEQ